jgi:hypothetical protein
MGSDMGVPINELAGFLARLGPDKQGEYKAAFPELAAELAPGYVLGEADKAEPRALIIKKAQAMAKLLAEASQMCAASTEFTASRIRKSNVVKQMGQYASIVGSASFVGSLQLSDKTTAMVIGILTTVAALASVIAEHFLAALSKDRTATAIYAELTAASAEVRLVREDLSAALEVSDQVSDELLRDLVGRGNSVFRTITKAGADMGLKPATAV